MQTEQHGYDMTEFQHEWNPQTMAMIREMEPKNHEDITGNQEAAMHALHHFDMKDIAQLQFAARELRAKISQNFTSTQKLYDHVIAHRADLIAQTRQKLEARHELHALPKGKYAFLDNENQI